MRIDDRTVLVTSQLTSSPAVARLHQWPTTVAGSLTGTLRSIADMLDRYACDAAILIDETQSAQTQFLRDTEPKR
ncbi:hypothetical protein AU190_15710 [Mycolicibacterium acapulense]|nr:hypothetical protein AU190_15710 [Mycolicibacterium acapulense]KUI13566.1 hypothetical protein AU191_10525 [Mycolicibacterium acapulense]